MNFDLNEQATDTRRKHLQVLVLVDQSEERTLIQRWVSAQPGYDLVDSVEPGGFELCFFDRTGFERHTSALSAAKSQAAPATLPFVLVVPETSDRPGSFSAWRSVEREYGGLVDDVITAPLRPVGLAGTVRSTLRLRNRTGLFDEYGDGDGTYRQIVDAIDQAVYVTDTDGVIEFVNTAFIDITGYEQTEACGETPAILNSGHQDDAYYRRLWETIRGGNVWSERVVNQRKDGERYHAKQTIVPVTDGRDDVRGYVAIQTDITERTNRTRHLEVLERVLRHNLRNDLNVIKGRAELIEQASTNGLAEHAEAILDKSNSLVETADKERAVVRHVVREETPTEQNVTQVARTVAEDVSQSAPEATIRTSLEPETFATASPKLEDAIEELLVNAIDHNDTEQPTVDLTVTEQAGAGEIVVSDDGPGIPENDGEVLRREQPPDKLFHGSGLGLWLVRWIVSFSHGTISLAKNEPRGTTITVALTDTEYRPELMARRDAA